MRITNPTIVRNYSKNLNRNQKLLNDLNLKFQTRQKFFTMAEDTASGVRAMRVRRNLQRIDTFIDNCKDAKSVFAMGEKTLLQVSSLSDIVHSDKISAINDTNSPDEREIYATELEQLRDEILTLMNAKASDRFVFGGTNTHSRPFTVKNDELYYNGVRVADIDKNDPQYAYLFNDAAYVDVGLGIDTQSANPQELVSNTAFKNTVVGLDVFGAGEENIYNRLNALIDSLREPNYNHDKAGELLDKFRESADSILLQVAKFGSDAQYLDFTIDRLETEALNLIERQDDLEKVNEYQAAIEFEMQVSIYNAALAMGQRLIQPTLFSFIS